jgi:hypothetical protein
MTRQRPDSVVIPHTQESQQVEVESGLAETTLVGETTYREIRGDFAFKAPSQHELRDLGKSPHTHEQENGRSGSPFPRSSLER